MHCSIHVSVWNKFKLTCPSIFPPDQLCIMSTLFVLFTFLINNNLVFDKKQPLA